MKLPRSLVLVYFAVALAGAPAVAQERRPMGHEVWDSWKRIEEERLSDDGRWLLYALTVLDGDVELRVHSLESDRTFAIPRGRDARFSADSRYVVFLIKPQDSIVKALRRTETEASALPNDSLGVLDLRTGEVTRVDSVESFELPEDGGAWVAYHRPGASRDSAAGNEEDDQKREAGTDLVLRDLAAGTETAFPHVTVYTASKPGNRLAFARSTDDGSGDGAFIVDPASGAATAIMEGEGHYVKLAFADDGQQLAFLSDHEDYAADQPAFRLYRWREGSPQAVELARATTRGVPAGWWISEHGDVEFSSSGGRVFFGTAPRPVPKPEEVPEWEKVELDVWHWRDPLLQPMQLLQREDELKRTYRAVVLEDGRVVQLADESMPTVTVADDGDGDVAFSASNVPYRREISWDSPRYFDLYVIDVPSGERREVYERLQGNARLSPQGTSIAWWDGNARAWFALAVDGREPVNISAAVPTRLDNELHDWPYLPDPYGMAGWTEDDGSILVYDKHDVWALDVTGRSDPRNVTEGVGRRDNLRLRYLRVDPEEDAIALDSPIFLSALDLGDKSGAIYVDRVRGTRPPSRLVGSNHLYRGVQKARDADVLMYTRESFREFPNLWVSGLTFRDARRISDANPQQAEYAWGDAELVHWRSVDGRPHEGLLFKPDGFDPSHQYPMMVYFYEKNSDGLNAHRAPFIGGSSINVTFYVSRGYVVFVPDVHYRVGYPGESALNSVVSGVLSILEHGYIDPARVGVQGHSWGGYQVAYLVTRTNIFAAAEAGAPVSNMTSAYGGIRWASGMSRMFQYEKTQSRLGGTLWNARARYIENSPLFWADKVETPLLMMHNDADGAVPWYQGIEFFVALRRLEKPAWMLNYNGEAHGLRKTQNRRDWQVRMQQFFDHYLLDAASPVWLEEGIPAVAKGLTDGLELVTEPTASGSGRGN